MADKESIATEPVTEIERAPAPRAAPASLALVASLMAACGGGGESSAPAAVGATPGPAPAPTPSSPPPPAAPAPNPGPAPSPGPAPAPPPAAPAPPAKPTEQQASQFLAQATFGATREAITHVADAGYAAWIDEQFAVPRSQSHWDWLVSRGYLDIQYDNNRNLCDASLWRKFISSPDALRQRMTFALSQIFVVGIDGITGGWPSFAAAYYVDVLEEHAFGNFRTLLDAVSHTPAMGGYLTFRGNRKADAATGSLPDENYAREVMQLFTIGLHELNLDGTPKLASGKPIETYDQDDVSGLARVFTGWDFDTTAPALTLAPDRQGRPMTMTASRHETGTKTFLGTTIPASTDGLRSLQLALDALFLHANTAPFICRQLIQRLVTSNPSPAYVSRIASVFNNNGAGTRGDLRAVLRALLLDAEARRTAGAPPPVFGKLREPVLRFTAWARAAGAASATDRWDIGNTADPATRLGQSPLRSASVFNFFRPGYVPPNSALGTQALVAPELQITTESSVAGYLNYMQRAVAGLGIGEVRAAYTVFLPYASDPLRLVEELNLVYAAGRLPNASASAIAQAVSTIDASTASGRASRVQAATLLVLAAPQFIVQS